MAPADVENGLVTNGHDVLNGDELMVQKKADARKVVQSRLAAVEASQSASFLSQSSHRSFSFRKVTTLRDTTSRLSIKYLSQLDSSGREVLESFDTVEDVLDAIAVERLRYMPHDGSLLDRAFKWAVQVIGHINEFSRVLEPFILDGENAARLAWGSCLLLLQMGPDQIEVLVKSFRTFHRTTIQLAHLINHFVQLSSIPDIHGEMGNAYASLIDLISSVSVFYYRKANGSSGAVDIVEFDARFGQYIESFYVRKVKLIELMWSTSTIPEGVNNAAANLKEIREFLSFQDRAIQTILESRVPSYAEFTGDWFSSHLSRFKRRKNGVFIITGAQGSGKTVLSQWIIDQLQASTEDDDFDVISYRIHEDISATTSSTNLVKHLLLQVLDRNIGSQFLLRGLEKAIQLSSTNAPVAEVEDALWSALRIALKDTSRLMIVIDGFNGLGTVPKVLQQLGNLTVESPRCKVVILSRPLKMSLPQGTFQFSLEPVHVVNDIRVAVLEMLAATKPFSGLSYLERESIAEVLVSKSDGSFLWVQLVQQLAKQQRTVDDIISFVQTAPSAVHELLEQVLTKVDLADTETRSLLAWMLSAHRPLYVSEIRALLETDTRKVEHVRRVGSIQDDIILALGAFVSVNNGVVSFTHNVIRNYLLGLAGSVEDFSNGGKFPFHLKEAHYDLVTRCMAHAKIHVHDDVEISMTALTVSTQERFFKKYELLEYTARYWTSHFLSSPMADGDEYKLTATFKQCLSDSVLLALLEGGCHRSQYTYEEAEKLQTVALSIRKIVLGETAHSVLQSLFFAAIFSHEARLTHRLEYVYEAWTLSKVILGLSNTVVKACAEFFVSVLETIEETSETIITRKEELLLYLVEITKEYRGASHELTIKYSRILVQLYIEINQVDKATKVCKELYHLSISRYGQFSSETAEIATILLEQLHHLTESETVTEIIETSHEYTLRTLEVTDQKRIDSTFAVVDIYEKQGDITKAEAVFFDLWQGITRIEEASESIVEKQITVALAYSEFLVRHSSKDEAENVVSTLWTSIERRKTINVEKILSWTQTVSNHMRKMQWFSLAHSTLTSMWKKCQSLEVTTTSSQAIAESLLETVEEITTEVTETSTKTSTKKSVSKKERLEIMRETFEKVTASSYSSKSVSESTIRTAQTLVSTYIEEKQWSEAIHVSQRLLNQVWKDVETSQSVITLTENIEETTSIALQLAESYFETTQIEKATMVYENIFYSLLQSVHVEEEVISSTMTKVVAFYEKTYQFSQAIKLYQETIQVVHASLGTSHHLSIELNYTLADLAIRCHRLEEAVVAYTHILTVLTHDGYLYQSAIRAALVLCKTYEEQQKWEAAREVYAVLWQTITHRESEVEFEAELIQDVYRRYHTLLEVKLRVESSFIRELAYSYRETCIQVYGYEHQMTYEATVQLAEISQRIEEYHEESVSMYEWALDYQEKYSESTEVSEATTTETTTTTKKTTTIKKHLAGLYSKSETTVSKASQLYEEEFHSSLEQYGYSSQTTLSALEQLVHSYKKQESITEVHEILQSSVTTIFESETDTQKLTESARTLARLYLEIGDLEIAISISQSLRRRLVYESTKISRKATVFVVAFEEVITEGSYTTIMADLVSEMHLYDAFFTVSKTAKFTQAFTTGVRLLMFQRSRNLTEEYQQTDIELFEIFSSHFNGSEEIDVRAFYDICIEEVLQGDYELNVVVATVSIIYEHFESERFETAYSLTSLVNQFVHHVDGFRSSGILKQCFKLCQYLQGHGVKRASEEKLWKAMVGLSKSLLSNIINAYRTLGVKFTELEVTESNELTILLGEQRNFDELERILTDLWTSRIVQKTWSPDTIVSVGRRLVEARFSCGKTEQAIRLCTDICYNLRRVWGVFDRTALELISLLSELYTTTHNYRAAMAVHEKILRQLTVTDANDLSLSEAAAIAWKHAELLQRSAQRLHGWDKNVNVYQDIFKTLNERFAAESAWVQTSLETLEIWPTSEADNLGVWYAPASYGFLLIDGLSLNGSSEHAKRPPLHQNQLRKVSESRLLTMSHFA